MLRYHGVDLVILGIVIAIKEIELAQAILEIESLRVKVTVRRD